MTQKCLLDRKVCSTAFPSTLRRKGVEGYDVNEDYSQLCDGCHKMVVLMYSEGGEFAIHGVRHCLPAISMLY